jgi:8-oxo-dGTP pyrophosphatase MutT (NUDIX family)
VSTQRADRLRVLLTQYSAADDAEAEHLRRMSALIDQQRAFDRSHYVPGHFTASAFIVSPEGDALLLIHHRKLGRWLQPGGHVEADDADLLAAARRECAEEVELPDLPLHPAVPGIFDLDVHRIPPHGDSPAHEHFDVRFLFCAPSRAFGVGDEVADGRWAPLDQVVEDPASDPSVLRALRKLARYR